MKNKKIPAIYDEDLIKFLNRTGQFQKIENGEIFCSSCHQLINLKNIQVIIPLSADKFDYICNDIHCVESFYKEMGHKE